MTNLIKCLYCGREFEISEALREHIKNEELADYKKATEEELIRLRQRAEQAEKNELDIRKQKEAFEEEKRKFELEKQRQLDEEREKIRLKALNDQLEQDRLKFKQYETTIESMNRTIEQLKQKATRGSQQLQGEVQELDLEDILRKLFPQDDIVEVKKGEMGADVRQIVKSPRGRDCGKILWESKRTKAWSDTWIGKLKEDIRRDAAYCGVIVTAVLPADFNKEIGEKEGIWIVSTRFVDVIACSLRNLLYEVAKQKAITINKQSKAEELYDYITGQEFKHQVERMAEIYLEMKNQVSRERAASERQFRQRETQIDILITGVSGIVGSMQGIAGSAIPQIKQLHAGEEE